EKLMSVAAQHGTKIKELMAGVASSVTQVEFMAAITTTRFQALNVVKAMKEDKKAAEEEMAAASASIPMPNDRRQYALLDDSASEIKQLKAQLLHLENELYQHNFKAGLDQKKLETELKIARKESYELKGYVEALERKLEKFAEAVEQGGIATNISFI